MENIFSIIAGVICLLGAGYLLLQRWAYRLQNKPISKWNEKLVMLLAFLAVVFFLWPQRANAAETKEVQYNPEKSPIAVKEMEAVIKYAAEYAWSQYLDLPGSYTGTTGEVLVDGKIIVRWENLTWKKVSAMAARPTPGLRVHRADLGELDLRLGYAQWWTRTSDGSFVKAEIVLNIDFVFEKHVDECIYELVVHEIGHVYGADTHSANIEDVMYPSRGDCHYSPSLADLALFKKPLKSCHVELTPHGDLELLDYNGQRIALAPLTLQNSLEPPRFGRWIWGSIYKNPAPQRCTGAMVIDGEVWIEVKSSTGDHYVLQLLQQNGLFVAGKKFPQIGGRP